MKDVDIYTDGACKGNPGPGGYGCVLLYRDNKNQLHKKTLSAGYKKTTNNRMELLAVIVALQALKTPCNVTIFSDSKYVVQAFNQHWIDGWIKKNWKKVKNVDLWKKLLMLCNNHNITFQWVKGHNNNKYNEICDDLASSCAQNSAINIDPKYC